MSIFAVAWSSICLSQASAVISFDNPTRNTAAPTGALLDAWNLQGRFNNFNVTPISPNQFIMAKHIFGGTETAGQTMTFREQAYTTTGTPIDIAGTDLRIWTIDTSGGTRTFPAYAPLWDVSVDGSEVGKPLVVFGRGGARGTPIYAPISPGPIVTPVMPTPIALTGGTMTTPSPVPTGSGELRGWKWTTNDGIQSWGENVVSYITNSPAYGDLLAFDFDTDPTLRVANEAALSVGDSSGGVFILSEGVWKLAGVNLGVDGPWSFSSLGGYFHGAVFDARGLFIGSSASNVQLPYTLNPLAGSSYASLISSNFAAIQTAIHPAGGPPLVPEPATLATVSLVPILLRRRRDRNAK